MPELLTPGVYFETVDRGRGGVQPLRTDIAGFVGLTERGPLDTPLRVETFEQYLSAYGGLLPNAHLPWAVKGFFDNGGRTAWIVRVAAAAVTTASDDGGPQERGAVTVASVVGFVEGAAATVRQTTAAGEERVFPALVKSVDPGLRRLAWHRSLPPSFDPALPFTVETGVAAAAATVPGEDGRASLQITAADPGAWGDALAVRVSRSVAAASRLLTASRLASVAGLDVGALVRLTQDGPGGTAPRRLHRVVVALDPATATVTWDRPLDPSLDVTDLERRPVITEVLEFGLTVELAGRPVAVHPGLSLVEEHPRWVERALEESHFVRATDVRAGEALATLPHRLPDAAAAGTLVGGGPGIAGRFPLAGGRDGIAAVEPRHLVGGTDGDGRRTGLAALEAVDEVALVAMPDAVLQATPAVESLPRPAPEPDPCRPCNPCNPCDPCDPESLTPETLQAPTPGRVHERAPHFGLEDTFLLQMALVAHCEAQGDRFALLDPPVLDGSFSNGAGANGAGSGGLDAVPLGELAAWRKRFDTSFAALYFPWLRVLAPSMAGRPNANRHPGEPVREIPPSGHLAGLYARTDLARGVHRAPANAELSWVEGLTATVRPEAQGFLHPRGVNVLRAFPGRGIRPWGARTLSSDTRWRHVPVRRLFLMIAEALEEALQWTVFEPHDFRLRQSLALAVSGFLEQLWRDGALAGERAAEAFFVRCDEVTNPPEVVDAGQLVALVGIAPAIPAEFVLVRIGRHEDSLTVDLLADPRVAA